MLYVIPNTNGYGIRDNCTIWYKNRLIHSNPSKPVTIPIFGKKVTKMPAWLLCVSKIGKFDMFDLNHLHFEHVQISRSKFPWFSWYDTPKVVFDKYRVVPSYPELAVSENGAIIHSDTGKPYHVVYSTDGHAYVHNTRGYTGQYYMVGLHRLVAMAWVVNNNPKVNTVVNHLKGGENPLDNSASNLEWTTPAGNAYHAVQTGLLPFASPCKIRHRITGEIKEFPSVHDACKFLGVAVPKEINNYKIRRINKLFNDVWELRVHGDNRPWIYEQNYMNVEPGRYIIKVSEPNSETKVFNGVRSLIKHYKLWNMGGTSCKRAVERLSLDHPEYKVEVIDQYDLSPIEVKNIETGEVKEYPSNKALHEATGWCKTSVIDAIGYAGKRVIYDKYVLRRKSNKPWPKDLRVNKCRPVMVKFLNKQTLQTTVYKSLRDASRKTGIDRDAIKRMLTHPYKRDEYIVSREQNSLSIE